MASWAQSRDCWPHALHIWEQFSAMTFLGIAGALANAVRRLTVLFIGHLDESPENVGRLLDGFAQLNKDLLRYKLAVQDATVAR